MPEGAAQTLPDGSTASLPAPGEGAVTRLPLPRFVTLKTDEGNARRGPGLSHRIDWVFKRAGMPLRVTAEYENWRR
ncbi:MAG: SH3 domain-containing protein, partial [Gemmobacter sp.]